MPLRSFRVVISAFNAGGFWFQPGCFRVSSVREGNSSLGRRADRAGIGPIAEAKLTMRDARAWISKMINLKDQSRIVDIRRNQSWGPAGKKARNFPIAVVPCRQLRINILRP